MYKHVALLVRQEGVSHEEFVERWQASDPVTGQLEGVVRYQQVLPTEPEHAEFDGLGELYVEDPEALPGLKTGYDDPKIGRRYTFVGEEIVQKDEVDGDTHGLYKHSAFLVRTEGLTHEEFVDYWQTNHTPIAREIEGVVKYNTVLPSDPERAAFDGVAELYFEDLEKLYDALGSEGSRDYDPDRGKAKEAREDVDNFLAIDERPRFIGRERVVEDRT